MKLLNSATIPGPLGLVEKGGGWRRASFAVRYGLIEAAGQHVLVDTGYGPRVSRGPRSTALRIYAALLRPRLLPFDVSADTILLTHFHADHVARLRDFPKARLLASRAAIDAFALMSPREATRHAIFPELLPDDFLARVAPVEVLPRVATGTCLGDGYDLCGDQSHLAIPLPGHAPGHLGIFWREARAPKLYATDVAWTLPALKNSSTPDFARRLVFHDAEAGLATEAKVRAFMRDGGQVHLCHDPL